MKNHLVSLLFIGAGCATVPASSRPAEKADVVVRDRQAKAEPERDARLDAAMHQLESIATVREDPRGKIITLQGNELFGPGDYRLLSSAKPRLDQVADALKAQAGGRLLSVEGHTDGLGVDEANQALTTNRANAVRSYLIARGVDAARITAKGLGALFPIDSNTTPTNRARNRRVEIVISAVER